MEVDVGGALMRKDEERIGTIGRRGCGGEEEWNRGWDDSRKEGRGGGEEGDVENVKEKD